jgi:hypothetical protein
LVLADRYWDGGLLWAVAAFGFFAFPLYAISVAHLNDFVEPDGFVEAAGGLLLVYAAGAVVGPLIAAAAMRGYGVDSLFAFTAAVHFATACYAVYRLTQRVAPPDEERVHFADSILLAQTVSTVDPLPDHTPEPETKGDSAAEASSEKP